MEIKRSGTQPSAQGPAEYFTGRVRVDPLFQAPAPARGFGVTPGFGFVQSWGGPVEAIRPGDVVWCPPGEKHWHGASPTTAMTHAAAAQHANEEK